MNWPISKHYYGHSTAEVTIISKNEYVFLHMGSLWVLILSLDVDFDKAVGVGWIKQWGLVGLSSGGLREVCEVCLVTLFEHVFVF